MIDFHSHTNFSHCADKHVDLSLYKEEIEKNPLLDAVCITDHGMAIYFPDEIAWSWDFIRNEYVLDNYLDIGNARIEQYIDSFRKYKDSPIYCGMEVEMSESGRLIYDPFYREKLFPLIGSVHFLFTTKEYGFSSCDILKEWTYHTEKLICSGINILGHPFRWISSHASISDPIIEHIVKFAHREGVAMEINGHNMTIPNYNTDKTMLKVAAELGAKVSLGIDAHKIKEIGDFSYHFKICNDCGLTMKDLNLLSIEELYNRNKSRSM